MLAGRKVKLPDGREVPQPMILTLPPSFMDPGGSGTASDPFIKLIGPAWMLNDTYRVQFQTADGKWYQTWRYDQAFADALVRLIRAAAERYDRHPGVSLVRLYVGFQGENQPVRACERWWPGSPACGAAHEVLPALETVVPCATYTRFVEQLARAAAEAFRHKPVAVMMSAQPCTDVSGTIHRWALFDQKLRPTPVGYSNNGLWPDRPDAAESADKPWAAWRPYTTGRTISAWGAPYVAEYGDNPWGASVGAQDRSQYMYWSTLMAAGSGARWVLHHPTWQGYDSVPMWEVVDYWLNGTSRAWLIFRDREYPTFEYAPTSGASGWIGDFARHLTLLNPQDAPQACSPLLRATAQAANANAGKWQRVTPACPEPLPTPAATLAPTPRPGADTLNRLFNRQARRLAPGKRLYIAASEAWPHFGAIRQVTVTVSYLDIGTTPFTLALPDARGAGQERTVPKEGTRNWKRFTWSQTARIANVLTNGAFIVIANPAGGRAVYLHEIYVDVGNGNPSPALTGTPAITLSATPTASPTATRTPSPTPPPTPAVVRAKVEIVWPHGGASVREARLANVTAYLLAGDGSDPAAALNPPPCDWSPTVRLWAALNTQPARPIAVGQKRFVNEGGRVFPAWDFNDVDVSLARDPTNKLTFFVTVDGVRTFHNIWVHAGDARTFFPQQDMPVSTSSRRPTAVDARIQIVWPHGNLSVDQARLANITAVLFQPDTLQAFAPDVAWSPTVRLHWALNSDPERPIGSGLVGIPRIVNAANGMRFLVWDFNDVDVSPAQDALNKLFFWVSVDGMPTYSNVWAHGQDARTIFPRPDVLNSCR